jgi:hypothetical protein
VWKGYTRCPSGRNDGARRRHRVGYGQAAGDFSWPKQPPPPPPRTLHRAPPSRPSTSMRHHGLGVILVVSLRSPRQGQEEEEEDTGVGGSRTAATREGTSSTAAAATDRTRQPGQTRPLLARQGPKQARKAPSPRCSTPVDSTAAAARRPLAPDHQHQGASTARRTASPHEPRWGRKGPDLGRAGAAGQPHHHVAPRRRIREPSASPRRAAAALGAPPPGGKEHRRREGNVEWMEK